MYVNCNSKLKIGVKYVKSVKEFKYLGLIMATTVETQKPFYKLELTKLRVFFTQ
jgi:hypothetical protein